jgi:hypothetical protein
MSDAHPTIPEITEEQKTLAKRLHGIFMPHARKEFDAIYKDPDRPIRFVHYTTAAAAINIIKTKRIWTRNTNCMSDYREVQHGFDMLASFFQNETKRNSFLQALDAVAPGVAQESITLFDQSFHDIRFNTYIASLSEHDDYEDSHGRLSMWRAFGGRNAARVAIVLRIPQISPAPLALHAVFSPIAYMNEAQVHAELDAIVQNVQRETDFLRTVDRQVLINTIFLMFLAAAACSKHEGFLEEREWRILYSPDRWPSPIVESSTETIDGVPQLIYKIPLDVSASPALEQIDFARMFDRLIIGPSPYPWVMYRAFVEALKSAGVADADQRVVASNIPIRG